MNVGAVTSKHNKMHHQ